MTGDPSVQVPVSLPTREQIAEAWDRAREDNSIPRERDGSMMPVDAFEAGFRSALTLLSQPTSTAESVMMLTDMPGDGYIVTAPAEPPRIDALPPGPVGPNGHRWPCTRFYTSSTERDECSCDAGDRSTIRDVTPPKEAP